MIQIQNNQVFSTEDKYIHRRCTESYFKRGTLLKNDTVDDFEEVDEIPPYTQADYEEKVNELIRARYSVSQELAILRQRDTKPDEFVEYNTFAERCKAEARQTLGL